MRLFVKFYPDIDTVKLELAPEQTLQDLINKVYEMTNLTDVDNLKIVYRSIPIVNKKMPLNELNLQGDETFHFVVNSCKAGRFQVNAPKAVGPITDNDVLLKIFSFLDHKGLVDLNLVCRKWRVLTNNNQALWKWNFEAILNRHRGDVAEKEEEAKPAATPSAKEGLKSPRGHRPSVIQKTPMYKNWFIQRFLSEQTWAHVKSLSLSSDITNADASTMKKAREVKMKAKPKPLTEEELKFLKETDTKELKKNLRRDKKAQELLKKHNTLAKKQETYDKIVSCNAATPDKWKQFSYNELMLRTMGFPHVKNQDGFECVYNNGRFHIFKDKVLVLVASVEPISKDLFKIGRFLIEEEVQNNVFTPLDDPASISLFFKLLEECGTTHVAEKKFFRVKVGNAEQDSAVDAHYHLNVIVAPEFAAEAKHEPIVAPKVTTPSTPTGIGAFNKEENKREYEVRVTLFNAADGATANEECITKLYQDVLVSANKDDQVSTASIPAVESHVLKLEDGPLKQQIQTSAGTFLAKAITSFFNSEKKTQNQEEEEETQQTQSADDAPESASKKVKKEFKLLALYVSSPEEKQLVVDGLRKSLN
jgi:hypothetical protein